MAEHEQQRELWALRVINEAPEHYRQRCLYELVNFVYWLSKQKIYTDQEGNGHLQPDPFRNRRLATIALI